MNEQPIQFDCEGAALVGMLHRTAQPAQRGVLIVVGGGPQYRAGGHRQLVLWSRQLAQLGHPVLRFDYRGMGDSDGPFAGFEQVDEDIRAAIDRFFIEVPSLREVVLWGECDGASAILFYAYRDPRVTGAVLLNPWARTEGLRARAVLRHYYLRRLIEPSFWGKLLSGRMRPWATLRSFLETVKQSRASVAGGSGRASTDLHAALSRELPLPDRLLTGLRRFDGRIMLVMSGRDLIAREFDELIRGSAEWQSEIARKPITRHDLVDGDHTFSSDAQRRQVIGWALAWLDHAPGDAKRAAGTAG